MNWTFKFNCLRLTNQFRVWVHVCHGPHVDDKGQFVGVGYVRMRARMKLRSSLLSVSALILWAIPLAQNWIFNMYIFTESSAELEHNFFL